LATFFRRKWNPREGDHNRQGDCFRNWQQNLMAGGTTLILFFHSNRAADHDADHEQPESAQAQRDILKQLISRQQALAAQETDSRGQAGHEDPNLLQGFFFFCHHILRREIFILW